MKSPPTILAAILEVPITVRLNAIYVAPEAALYPLI
jgi:hypothetical protein